MLTSTRVTATANEIRAWLERRPPAATHMLVITDRWEWDNFPYYVLPPETPTDVMEREGFTRDGSPDSPLYVEECYSFALSLDEQMQEVRARHYD